MALGNAVFLRLPIARIQKVGMVAHEDFTHGIVAQQKRGKCFGEHVAWADAVPDFPTHFFFFVAWFGHFAEVAIGDVFDLVVVVKHHLAVAGDAKVLPQHVAREDVGGHQVFDGVAVLHHRAASCSSGGAGRPGRCQRLLAGRC
jgi:hypothetical protein